MTKGYKNECDFAKSINNKKYGELCNNLKRFIKYIFKDVKEDDILECARFRTHDKADIYIKLNDDVKNVSIKSGNRVSVHAEPIYSFVAFLKSMKVNIRIINYLLLYHYGDFTLNGKGSVRLPAKELKIRYEKEIKTFNKYVNYKNIISKTVTRCLFDGVRKENTVDYIYYGSVNEGLYASKEEIINYFCHNKAYEIETPHFSYLIYQNWNRNIIYNQKLESHRYYCQFKWPSIEEDLKKIREQ